MEIKEEKQNNIVIVSVKGKLDAVTSSEFDKRMSELIEKGEKKFIISLAELNYISSAGLKSILGIAKKTQILIRLSRAGFASGQCERGV
ncbi:MAG TPA: STAS domain-containing protein [Thermodesulfovibrionia bacterium]|nr:STAS domain-containing protein [Thermodesulfovibrionia bacterium]